MPDEIEMQKRANYHDLGRDDWMSLDEYLLSGLSDRDLGLAKGGMANINDMTGSISSPKRGYVDGPGSYAGEYIPGQNVSKITEHLASIRFDREAFFKGVEEAGFTKKNGSVDLKAFERHLNKKGLSMWKMKSQRMMNSVTNELNDLLGGKYYKNVKKYSQKSILENLASKFKGFKGKYAEMYSAFTKEKFWEDALNLQEKGDKKFGTKKAKEKLLWIARQLKTKWPSISIGTTVTALSKYGFGAFMGGPSMIGADIMMQMMEDPDYMKAVGFGESEPLTYKGGGMADINDMTRPLKGYNSGGPAGMTDLERTGYDRSKSSAWNINDLVRDVVGDIGTSIKSKVSGAGEKIKNLFEGGDDSRYMRFFDKLWKEGYSQKQIDMIWNSGGKINKEDIVPERVEYDFDKEKSFVPEGEFRGAKGGIVSLNHLTRRL
mgnify:CR=1 FL=1